jgi:hypothetical protein
MYRIETGYTATGAFTLFPNLPAPLFSSLDAGGALIPEMAGGKVSGYTTTTGGVLGLWGTQAGGGSYVPGPESSWISSFGFTTLGTGSALPPMAAMGLLGGQDDGEGHVEFGVLGYDKLTYLDSDYLGTLEIRSRGTYGATNAYEGVAVGFYDLKPLIFRGVWGGMPNNATTLYYNDGTGRMAIGGHEMGLMGGLTPFWTGAANVVAMGSYTDTAGVPSYLFNSFIEGSGSQGTTAASFRGFAAGIWRDGYLTGNLAALYAAADGKAGWLTDVNPYISDYNAGLKMWKASIDVAPQEVTGLEGKTHVRISDLQPQVFHARLSGQFIDTDREQRTNVPGVFAAGDCVGRFMQISVAVGEGAKAGRAAIAYVKERLAAATRQAG